MALEKEVATFRRELANLLANPSNHGQFALIHAEGIFGLHPSFEAALAAGYDRFGLAPFLVKEVTAHETPRYFSRTLAS